MHFIISLAIELSSAAVFLIPIILILNAAYLRDAKKCIAYMLFTLYLAAVSVVVGMPSVNSLTFDPTVEVIPFISMISDAKNCVLNVILFVPLGMFLPLLWERFRSPARVILFGFCTSLTIEILQLFTFRTTDADDLITNTLGAAIGYFIAKSISGKWQMVKPEEHTRDVYLLCGIVFAVMFFAQPFLSGVIWDIVYV